WDQAIDIGYVRLEAGLIEAACNLFSAPELDPGGPIAPISADDAFHLLFMHQKQARQIGKRPGRAARYRSAEEVVPRLVRKIKAMIRATEIDADDKARCEREWARRRPSGPMPE
ncbi:MAG: hypothetical protein JWL74_1046, partial [Alphaproteobacteria bacterium]|nr:hypothetical protein [Alphaproteobacteria bacterium]